MAFLFRQTGLNTARVKSCQRVKKKILKLSVIVYSERRRNIVKLFSLGYDKSVEHLFDRKEEIMTLRELGEEYIVCADELKKRASALSDKLNELDGIRFYETSRDIKIIRDMERDSRSIGMHLMNYYENKTDRRIYHRQ